MSSIYRSTFRALKSALRHLWHPTILGVLLVPAIAAIVIWSGVSWWFWDSWTAMVESILVSATDDGWAARLELSRFAGFVAVLTVVLLVVPAILVTSMLISAVFAMPVLVAQVSRRDYPDLELRQGGTFVGSIVNALTSVSAFALMWVITLPVWIFLGPLAVIVPLALSAYLNQRLFRYDALAEHASATEMRRIYSERFPNLFVLGLATGLLYFVPLVNLIAPVFSALAFTCLCLDELEQIRSADGGGSTAK